MKVEYVEPFVDAASDVLHQILGCNPTKGAPGLTGAIFPTACINIAARVDGSLQGNVVCSMSTKTACKLTESILGVQAHVFGRQMGSALVKLGNDLIEYSSRLLAERGLDCRVSSPTVFQGMNVEFSSLTPALVVPIDTNVGRVEISVAVDDDQQS